MFEHQSHIKIKCRHYNHFTKWEDKQIDTAIRWIEENPMLTLNEIICKGLENRFRFIQPISLSSYLNDGLNKLKKKRLNPVAVH